ncbi:MAG: hypothetical protein B6D56_02165 [Candidatus Omnitrophica bacterium 4484_70.1]|nr:MAG: hypothetical protein B6D56_02165 [Candidatus Omnitrophica bacterium 4484_70.1]
MYTWSGLLYVIIDEQTVRRNKLNIYNLARKLSCLDIDIFQFRFYNIEDNTALSIGIKLSKIFHEKRKVFIINNRVDFAYLCEANGVHLGEDDIPPFFARNLLGKNKLVGRTIHSYSEFSKIKKEPVDYLSLGPLFPTELKPSLRCCPQSEVKKILKNSKKPIFAIGGITTQNLDKVIEMGFKNIALCREIILSENPKKIVKIFKKKLSSLKK